MASGLPVVASDVGGNRDVVPDEHLGTIVEFGHEAQLQTALRQALRRDWDRARIIAYARENAWHNRIKLLVDQFMRLPDKARAMATTSPRTRRV
jgi:glycosyltransferase involved in cell wall biosynthesis